MRFNDIFLYEFRCISIAISHQKEMCTNVNYKKHWYRIKQILLRLVLSSREVNIILFLARKLMKKHSVLCLLVRKIKERLLVVIMLKLTTSILS